MPPRFTSLAITRYKSFDTARLELGSLTVLVGRNNNGKSSLIQPLLLMRQSLDVPRKDIALNLSGAYVTARSIRDLTARWPAAAPFVPGPEFVVEWETDVDLERAKEGWLNANAAVVSERSGLGQLLDSPTVHLHVRMEVKFGERAGAVSVEGLVFKEHGTGVEAEVRREADGFGLYWRGEFTAGSAHVTLDHFLPYIDVGRIRLGRNDYRRAYINAWLATFAPAIEDLRLLLGRLQYLSSARQTPRETNEPIITPPSEVGADGSSAAAMFKSRRNDFVHYSPVPAVGDGELRFDDSVRQRPFGEAVNDVLSALGVPGSFDIDDGAMFGYRLLFGGASLPHVGRGLSYLLPVVEVGLLGDPLRFEDAGGDLSLDEYVRRMPAVMPILLEEPESHLNPKVQSKLAHWLVALARSGRQVIVETHSDHLVRRLRGLIARAPQGSDTERWLLDNVRIYGVTQNDGVSAITPLMVSPGGELSAWPEDFLEEGSNEDTAIFYSGLAKQDRRPEAPTATSIIHDEGDEEGGAQ